MTHEKAPDGEPFHGPENDQSLPNAWEFPTYEHPADSDLPTLSADLEV